MTCRSILNPLRHSYGIATIYFVLMGVACTERRSPGQTSTNVPAKSGPGDSLAKLSRLLLTDSNTHEIAQAITCENVRLIRLYGGAKAAKITAEVDDTIYRSTDEAALRRAEARVANHVFDLSCGYPPGQYPKPSDPDSL